ERCLPYTQAHFSLEKLAPVGNQVHDRDRCAADIRGELGDIVKIHLARRVENLVSRQRCQPLLFAVDGLVDRNTHRSDSFRSSPSLVAVIGSWFGRYEPSTAAKTYKAGISIAQAFAPDAS